ncbi:MAG: TetR/AcrR family transcriptional regulator [Actinobacteria bacterium]|nr:TetR/AcrR family transcriptional regulator [Actinomycetota bacterium]
MTQVDAVGSTLLRAARDVLAAEGPGALTVRRIAAEAGVSTMNVYSRFGGKDGVIDHLFIEGFQRLSDAVAAAPHTDDPLDDLRRCGACYRAFALANPTYYSIMFDRAVPDHVPSPEALERAGATLQQLADGVERAMRAGAIVAADPLETAASLWATTHGLVSLELKDAKPAHIDWARVFESTMAALVRGLATGAHAAP